MKVLIVAGASGGHIFPALSFLDTLKDKYKDIDTLLILPAHQRFCIIPDGYQVRYISIGPVKLSQGLKNSLAILRFFQGSLESLFILLEFRPDIVVGFGSLVSIPTVLLAWIFRIKTLIHEQNVIPGQANRLLAKFVDRVAVSFAKTKAHLSSCSRKVVLTGNPIRRELIRVAKDEALGFFGLSPDKFTILVMGGSIGSHRINTGFLNAILMLSKESGLQVIHLAGVKDYDLLRKGYQGLNINIKLFSFLRQMQYAYSACDLVVSRAGATTISEIISFRLPAIIVPYPFAYEHQLGNAKVLESKGCAIIIKDDKLDAHTLSLTIEDLMHNPDKVRKMRLHYESMLQPEAKDLLVNAAISLI